MTSVFARKAWLSIWGGLLSCAVLAAGCGKSTSTSRAENDLVAASKALAAGDDEGAFKSLSAAIDASPNPWAYFERARIHAKNGRDEEAKEDVQKGLALDPEHAELQWLSSELAKAPAERFQGPFANPPRRR